MGVTSVSNTVDTGAIFRLDEGTELTDKKLMEFIRKNDQLVTSRYQPLKNAYDNNYEIFDAVSKPRWKPDVRVSVNFAQYIVDTFEGFFIGIPVKVSSDDGDLNTFVAELFDTIDLDDTFAELSSTVSIYGRGYQIAYVNEDGDVGSAALTPIEAFAIYDEGITPKMRYFVRTYKDSDNKRHGSISDATTVRYFDIVGGAPSYTDEYHHGFGNVPAVEYIMNSSRRGVFESVLNLINEYNKALSEKGNDVESFAEAYMKVLGAKIDEATLEFMRTNRVINFGGTDGKDVVVDFLQKPTGDGTQEHLLDRLERLIFTVAMVCNISDDNFATSSGIALKYKLLPMINLASKKWTKFRAGMKKFFKLVCSNPVSSLGEDDWSRLTYVHSLNYPANMNDEAETASRLTGITSKKTQLSVLSFVDDVNEEMKQIAIEAGTAAENKAVDQNPVQANAGKPTSGQAAERDLAADGDEDTAQASKVVERT